MVDEADIHIDRQQTNRVNYIMKTEIISFYSDIDGTTYYSDCAKRLAAQLTALEIPHDIREKPSLGSYQRNCLSKPRFIYSLLEEKKRPIVWLDVDSIVLKLLDAFDIFEGNTDIALACTNINVSMSAKASPIYFAYNEKVFEFLTAWIRLADELDRSEKWFDHEALLSIVSTFGSNMELSVKLMNSTFCTWPGQENESSIIVMGLSDAESKKIKLRELGFNEEQIQWQSPGLK